MHIKLSKHEADVILADLPKDQIEAIIAEHFARIGADGGLTPTVSIFDDIDIDPDEVTGQPKVSEDGKSLLLDEIDRRKAGSRKDQAVLNLIRNRLNLTGRYRPTLWSGPGTGKTVLIKMVKTKTAKRKTVTKAKAKAKK